LGYEDAGPSDDACAPRVVLDAIRIRTPVPMLQLAAAIDAPDVLIAVDCERARISRETIAPRVVRNTAAGRPPPMLERAAGASREGMLLAALRDEYTWAARGAGSPGVVLNSIRARTPEPMLQAAALVDRPDVLEVADHDCSGIAGETTIRRPIVVARAIDRIPEPMVERAVGAACEDAINRDVEGSLFRRWLPFFEAFEAGAFSLLWTATEVVVSTLPSAVRVDDRRRLHCADGPAFAWLDIRDYYVRGVYVPEYVVERPSEISVQKIDAEKNAEVRRVMIERYGQDHYLLDSNAQEIHRDDYGVLYRKEIPGDEPLVMVKVVNSTAEPDGTFKDYFLRVPPNMTSARQAVAWTFGKTEKAYAPVLQT